MEEKNVTAHWQTIAISKSFVEKRRTPDGRGFYRVTLPEGVQVNESNLGGYGFNVSTFDVSEEWGSPFYQISLVRAMEITLTKDGRDKSISPEQLKEGLDAFLDQWQQMSRRQEFEKEKALVGHTNKSKIR